MARRKDKVLRTGEVSVEHKGKRYTAEYDVLDGGGGQLMVRLVTGQAGLLGGFTERGMARLLLNQWVPGAEEHEDALKDLGIMVEPLK
jgi:hypothetical protein